MKKILLVCNAGMSTSMLVAKMKKAAQADGVEVSIEAKSLADAKKEIQEANIVLLGPQIRYEPFFVAGRNDGMYVTSIAANRCSSIYNLAVANNYCKTFID